MAYLLEMSDSANEREAGPIKTTWIPSGKRISIFSSLVVGSGTSARRTGINPEIGFGTEIGFRITPVFPFSLKPDFLVKK